MERGNTFFEGIDVEKMAEETGLPKVSILMSVNPNRQVKLEDWQDFRSACAEKRLEKKLKELAEIFKKSPEGSTLKREVFMTLCELFPKNVQLSVF